MKKPIKFTILGKQWSMHPLSWRGYHRKYGSEDNSLGTTHTDVRRIDLREDGRDLETIIHELVHAYWYEMCLDSADLEDDQAEEIMAELMSKFGRELLDLADKLLAKVKT